MSLRKRNPTPTTTASAFPSDDATLEERTQYLLQEIGGEAGFLEQWIVHYLAELLDRAANTKAAPGVRSEARAEIARVLPALWEQQIAREAMHIRQEVNYQLRRTDTLSSEVTKFLGPLLSDPEALVNLDEADASNAFRAVHALAELVTRFLVTTAVSARLVVPSDALQKFLQLDEEVLELQRALAAAVPDFATLDLAGPDVERLGYDTLGRLAQTQLKLLSRFASMPVTGEAYKKANQKK